MPEVKLTDDELGRIVRQSFPHEDSAVRDAAANKASSACCQFVHDWNALPRRAFNSKYGDFSEFSRSEVSSALREWLNRQEIEAWQWE